MRKILFLFLILALSVGLATADTRRIVLLEEATNASCPPCASNNPQLQEQINASAATFLSQLLQDETDDRPSRFCTSVSWRGSGANTKNAPGERSGRS